MIIPESVPWRSIGRTLGSGGQGSVEVVTRRGADDGREYALKALRYNNSLSARGRFRREIEAVKNLSHPAVVPIVDYSGEDDEFQYYVMEYYPDAKPLHRVIFSPTNPYRGNVLKSLALFANIVSVIKACESADPQIVHRDIKPNNILLLPDETIRLIDFGICQIDGGTVLTLVDENVGARNYISPECEAGNDSEIGSHSDLYSAAKVLWSAITSRQAFPREQAVFGSLSMDQIFPDHPETWHLGHIFEKTIRQNPGDRCRKMSEVVVLVDELRYLVKGGFPPLKEVEDRCPSCGRNKTVVDFRQGYIVFGNPNPPGVKALMCNNCGFSFVRNTETLRDNINRLKGLS